MAAEPVPARKFPAGQAQTRFGPVLPLLVKAVEDPATEVLHEHVEEPAVLVAPVAQVAQAAAPVVSLKVPAAHKEQPAELAVVTAPV